MLFEVLTVSFTYYFLNSRQYVVYTTVYRAQATVFIQWSVHFYIDFSVYLSMKCVFVYFYSRKPLSAWTLRLLFVHLTPLYVMETVNFGVSTFDSFRQTRVCVKQSQSPGVAQFRGTIRWGWEQTNTLASALLMKPANRL